MYKRQAKTSGALSQPLVDALTTVYNKMKKDSSNRGRKNLNTPARQSVESFSKVNGKGNGKGKGKGHPPTQEMMLIDEDVFYICPLYKPDAPDRKISVRHSRTTR